MYLYLSTLAIGPLDLNQLQIPTTDTGGGEIEASLGYTAKLCLTETQHGLWILLSG